MSGVEPLLDETWQADGLCREVAAEFYSSDYGDTAHACRVCRLCPVITECLAYSLARRDRYGVWGGLSERARRRILGTPLDDQEEDAA